MRNRGHIPRKPSPLGQRCVTARDNYIRNADNPAPTLLEDLPPEECTAWDAVPVGPDGLVLVTPCNDQNTGPSTTRAPFYIGESYVWTAEGGATLLRRTGLPYVPSGEDDVEPKPLHTIRWEEWMTKHPDNDVEGCRNLYLAWCALEREANFKTELGLRAHPPPSVRGGGSLTDVAIEREEEWPFCDVFRVTLPNGTVLRNVHGTRALSAAVQMGIVMDFDPARVRGPLDGELMKAAREYVDSMGLRRQDLRWVLDMLEFHRVGKGYGAPPRIYRLPTLQLQYGVLDDEGNMLENGAGSDSFSFPSIETACMHACAARSLSL